MRQEISVKEVKDKLDKEEDFLFLDVREPFEYDERNLGAKNIPLGELMSQIDDLDTDKNAPIIVHCRSGQRSGMACDLLKAKGYQNVKNMTGGIEAWEN